MCVDGIGWLQSFDEFFTQQNCISRAEYHSKPLHRRDNTRLAAPYNRFLAEAAHKPWQFCHISPRAR
jgi:hypothetical protein